MGKKRPTRNFQRTLPNNYAALQARAGAALPLVAAAAALMSFNSTAEIKFA
jgi:hypothetical protein